MKDRDILLKCLGGYLVVTSVAASFGRLYGFPWMYDFGDGIGMAYATAVNFAVAGVAFIIIGSRLEKQ